VKAVCHLVVPTPWETWALRHEDPTCFSSIPCRSFGNSKAHPSGTLGEGRLRTKWMQWGKS